MCDVAGVHEADSARDAAGDDACDKVSRHLRDLFNRISQLITLHELDHHVHVNWTFQNIVKFNHTYIVYYSVIINNTSFI